MHISFTYKSRHTITQWLPHFTISFHYMYLCQALLIAHMLILLFTTRVLYSAKFFLFSHPYSFIGFTQGGYGFTCFFCKDKFSSVLSLPSSFASHLTNIVVLYFFCSLPSVCMYSVLAAIENQFNTVYLQPLPIESRGPITNTASSSVTINNIQFHTEHVNRGDKCNTASDNSWKRINVTPHDV